MFKRILLPTDGSELSNAAITKGMDFAKSVGASVIGIYVKPKFQVFTYRTEMVALTEEDFETDAEFFARQYLNVIEHAARELGVTCENMVTSSEHPHEAIIAASRQRECDLIIMASHGRKGIKGLLIGSETQKVLTHSHIPVLVYR